MRLAFCLFKFFPFGGLQRDFLKIALACQQKGHTIDVFTLEWQGAMPQDLNIYIIQVSAYTNHERAKQFAAKMCHFFKQEPYDLIIGFNRMPGLDVYFAADTCFAQQIAHKNIWSRLLSRWGSRYRTYLALEQAVFNPKAHTHIFYLNAMTKSGYQQHYKTPDQRFHLLPPGIQKERIRPKDAHIIRADNRYTLQFKAEHWVLLFIASSFYTKGLDRVLLALAALPNKLRQQTHLLVVGGDNPSAYQKQAAHLNIRSQLSFLGSCEDLLPLLLAADLLIHPARQEAAGMVLLEALVAGLPILTTANCGYAHHISAAGAGWVIDMPFSQALFNDSLSACLEPAALAQKQVNAISYSQKTDLFNLAPQASHLIEQLAQFSRERT